MLVLLVLLVLLPYTRGFGGGPIRGDKIPLLLSLIDGSNFGVVQDNVDEIVGLIDQISSENKMRRLQSVQGDWRLLWTTEKEILFFAKNGLFGKEVTTIVQSLDLKENQLTNSIKFKGNREFSVKGSIRSKIDNRIDFKFDALALTIPPLPTLNLPPVGQGYFDTLYVNEQFRFSKDIRGGKC